METDSTKTTVSVKNFSQGNTPATIETIGNYLLLAGTVGIAILGLPATLATAGVVFTLPVALHAVGAGLAAAGVIGKVITKLFGTKEKTEEENNTNQQ